MCIRDSYYFTCEHTETQRWISKDVIILKKIKKEHTQLVWAENRTRNYCNCYYYTKSRLNIGEEEGEERGGRTKHCLITFVQHTSPVSTETYISISENQQ